MTDAGARLSSALEGRYRIERELGRGGMATVYLAEDLKHDRNVALKALWPELGAAIGAERFLAEIRTTARLRHPHILPLFDSGDAGGLLYYVMPWVEGESLQQRVARDGPLPLGDALRITREVAGALAHAHAQGVIHRDIKPENILLDGEHALLTDFGIARAVSAAEDTRLTVTGLALGTPLYMSPEQSAGDPLADERSDLYSLAAVLFEMLAGRPPFVGDSPQAVLVQRFTQPAPRVSTLRSDVPEAVDAAVQRALERDPAERQASVERFAASLAEDRPARSAAADKSIAVLPFEDMSPDHDNEYFGDGIAEEIINALTRLDGLRVAARTSAFSFKGKREDLRVVGEKLNVATVLEGSVRKAGNRLRVTAQLITAADGYHLWSERYDRDLTDVFAVQDEIAAAIAEKLQVTYVKPAAAESSPATTGQVQAYELMLKGRALLEKRGSAIHEALACFERAVVLDPSSAAAHAGLGEALWVTAYYGLAPREETLSRARAALARALEIDPDLGEALGTSGIVAYSADWDIESARRLWSRALDVNPRLSEVRCGYAIRVVLSADRDDARGAAELERAVRDDPLSTICLADAALGMTLLGHLDAARTHAARALELDPNSFASHLAVAYASLFSRDYPRTLRAATAALQLSGRHAWVLSVTTSAYVGLGDLARAEATHSELLARAATGSAPSVWLSLSALALGRVDEAMEHAMDSVDKREVVGPWVLRFPTIEPLQAHARYPELLRKAGLAVVGTPDTRMVHG